MYPARPPVGELGGSESGPHAPERHAACRVSVGLQLLVEGADEGRESGNRELQLAAFRSLDESFID